MVLKIGQVFGILRPHGQEAEVLLRPNSSSPVNATRVNSTAATGRSMQSDDFVMVSRSSGCASSLSKQQTNDSPELRNEVLSASVKVSYVKPGNQSCRQACCKNDSTSNTYCSSEKHLVCPRTQFRCSGTFWLARSLSISLSLSLFHLPHSLSPCQQKMSRNVTWR